MGGWDIEGRSASGEGGGSAAVENYTTSINHLVPTVFLSLSLSFPLFPPISITFSPSSSSPWLCILPSFCDPTAPRPDSGPPGFLPFILLAPPALGALWSTAGHRHYPTLPPASFPLWFVYMLSLLIGPSFVACQGFIPCPVLAILEIDLFSLRVSRYSLLLSWDESFLKNVISFNLILRWYSEFLPSTEAFTPTLKWPQMTVNDAASCSSIFKT